MEIQSPQYSLDSVSVPAVSVTAARDTSGKLQVGLVNLDPKREAVRQVAERGADSAAGRNDEDVQQGRVPDGLMESVMALIFGMNTASRRAYCHDANQRSRQGNSSASAS